jgi:RNA polymerase sigma-70 factor (ECF subfamily)
MAHQQLDQHLSMLSTSWTALRLAHGGTEEAAAAQQLLIERYGGAVYRYLLRVVGDAHAADDLTQDFALNLVRGTFRHAAPEKGRFRNYIKTALFHMVSQHYKQGQKHPRAVSDDSPELADLAVAGMDFEEQFHTHWRDQLLARAWQALARVQPVGYAVLRCRADHPEMPSAEMARQLRDQLGQAFTPDRVRQALHRARDLFADLLLEETAQSLEPPSAELVEAELAELGLLDYCRAALKRRFGGGPEASPVAFTTGTSWAITRGDDPRQ